MRTFKLLPVLIAVLAAVVAYSAVGSSAKTQLPSRSLQDVSASGTSAPAGTLQVSLPNLWIDTANGRPSEAEHIRWTAPVGATSCKAPGETGADVTAPNFIDDGGPLFDVALSGQAYIPPRPSGATGSVSFKVTCYTPVDPSVIDSFPTDGNPAPNWQKLNNTGAVQVTGGQLAGVSTAANLNYYDPGNDGQNYGPDSEAFATVATLPGNGYRVRILVRGSTATGGSGYVCHFEQAAGTDTWEIRKLVNGSFTTIGSTMSAEVAAGDKIRCRAVGTTITASLYHAGVWTDIDTQTDASITAAGLIGAGVANVTGRIDDFGGGNSGVVTSTDLVNSSTLTARPVNPYGSATTVFDIRCAYIGSPRNGIGGDEGGSGDLPIPPFPAKAANGTRMMDPIKNPGQEDAAGMHFHDFFGHVGIGPSSDFSSLITGLDHAGTLADPFPTECREEDGDANGNADFSVPMRNMTGYWNPQTIYSSQGNELQKIHIGGSPTGGTVTFTYGGQTTSAISYSSLYKGWRVDQIQTALQALSSVGPGNALVTAVGNAINKKDGFVQFQGTLGSQNVSQMTGSGSFTGGNSPSMTVTTASEGTAADTSTTAIVPDHQHIYYRNESNRMVQSFEPGYKFITAGMDFANVGAADNSSNMNYWCAGPGDNPSTADPVDGDADADGPPRRGNITDCVGANGYHAQTVFPVCGSTSDDPATPGDQTGTAFGIPVTDSADHHSHAVYKVNGNCPDDGPGGNTDYPLLFPKLTAETQNLMPVVNGVRRLIQPNDDFKLGPMKMADGSFMPIEAWHWHMDQLFAWDAFRLDELDHICLNANDYDGGYPEFGVPANFDNDTLPYPQNIWKQDCKRFPPLPLPS